LLPAMGPANYFETLPVPSIRFGVLFHME